MVKYFKLIRPINLLIMALVVCLMQFCVINPILDAYGFSIVLFSLVFTLLLISILTIGASGYVINDYFDTKIDEINRPNKVIVGHGVTRHQAAVYFQTLLIIGNIAGIALAIILRNITLVFIYAGVSGILWFYSSSYKRQLLIGNIMVSLCTFLCVFLVGYVNVKGLILNYPDADLSATMQKCIGLSVAMIYAWTLGFGLFAFLLTMLREMVKDIEDIEGDTEMECRTMPIVWGVKVSKIVITVLSVVTIATIFYFANFKIIFKEDNITFVYSIILILFLLMFICQLWTAKCKPAYSQASLTLKIIMVMGVCYSIVFKMLI